MLAPGLNGSGSGVSASGIVVAGVAGDTGVAGVAGSIGAGSRASPDGFRAFPRPSKPGAFPPGLAGGIELGTCGFVPVLGLVGIVEPDPLGTVERLVSSNPLGGFVRGVNESFGMGLFGSCGRASLLLFRLGTRRKSSGGGSLL